MNLIFFLLFLSFFINVETSPDEEKDSPLLVDLMLEIRFFSNNMYDVLNIKKNELGFSLATLTQLEDASSFLKYHQENTKELDVPYISNCIVKDIQRLGPSHHTFMNYIPSFSKPILYFQELIHSFKYDPKNTEQKTLEQYKQLNLFKKKLRTNFLLLYEQIKTTISFTSSWVECFRIPLMFKDSHRLNDFFEKFQRLIIIMMLESSKPILWKHFPTLSALIENEQTNSPFFNPDFFFLTQGLKLTNIYFEKDATPRLMVYGRGYQALVFPEDMLINQNAFTSSIEFLNSFFLNTDIYRRSVQLWNTNPSTTLYSFQNIHTVILSYLSPIYTQIIQLPTNQGKVQRISIFDLGGGIGKRLKKRFHDMFQVKKAITEFPFLSKKDINDIQPLFGKQVHETLQLLMVLRNLFELTTTSKHVHPPVNFWSSSSYILSKHININYQPPTHGELIQAYHTQENTAATTTSNTKQETLSKEGQTEKESKVDLGLGTSQQASLRTPPQPIESDETRKRKEQNVETLATHVPEVKRFRQDQPNQAHAPLPTRPLDVVPPAPSLHSQPLIPAPSLAIENELSRTQEDVTYVTGETWLDHFDLDHLPSTETTENSVVQTMEVPLPTLPLNAIPHASFINSHPLIPASSLSIENEPSTIQEDAAYVEDEAWLDHFDLDHIDLDHLPPTQTNEDTNAQTMEVMNNDWLNAFEHEFSSSTERNVDSNAQNLEGSRTLDLGLPILHEDEVSATRNRYFEYVEDVTWEQNIESVNLNPLQDGIFENHEDLLNYDTLDDHGVMESRSSNPYDIHQPISYFADLASTLNEGLSESESDLSTPLHPYFF